MEITNSNYPIGAFHPFGKGRVSRIYETDRQHITEFSDENGTLTDTWERWLPNSYTIIQGTAFPPDTNTKLARFIADNMHAEFIVHLAGEIPDVQVGTLGRTGGQLKEPIFVPRFDDGGPILMLDWVYGFYTLPGSPVWLSTRLAPQRAVQPVNPNDLENLINTLEDRPMRPLILNCRVELPGQPALLVGTRLSMPENNQVTFKPHNAIHKRAIPLADILEVWTTDGDILWTLPLEN